MDPKRIIRKAIGAREKENIEDALLRKKTAIEKHIYTTGYSTEMLRETIRSCGISEGDIVMVHCSWRNMYNYDGTPEDVIEMLRSIVGESGTVLMPSYGPDRFSFDVQRTPSAAGVLSEVFRKQDGVYRSRCTHFSVSGSGKDAEELLSDHVNSRYGFDGHSPLAKLSGCPNGKVLFLGLGSRPTKISIFHCAGAYLRDSDDKLKRLLSKEYESELIDEGAHYTKSMYIRQPGHGNDKASFRRIFDSLNEKKVKKISNLDVVVIDAAEAFGQAVDFARRGIYCYKAMDRI